MVYVPRSAVPILLFFGMLFLAVLFSFLAFANDATASGGSGGSSSPSTNNNCPPFSTAPPVVRQVPRYNTASPASNPIPTIANWDDKLRTAVQKVSDSWYEGMISPGLCSSSELGTCMGTDFNRVQGTKVAAITATAAESTLGAPPPIQVSVDAVTTKETNSCGQSTTRWSWVVTPSSAARNVNFPKGTTVEVRYTCQPNQTYYWTTSNSCFLGIGTCNVKRHARAFMFASKAQSNIPAAPSGLQGSVTFVPEAGSTYSLACGGYRPENGSVEPPSYGAVNSNTGVCIFGIDCKGGSNFASYNVPDSSYWQPGVTMSVNVCTGDDEIVVNNVCTPCERVKAGSWRVGNMCVTNLPPTVTLRANGGPDGQNITVAPGTRVNIVAAYTPAPGDALTATAINDEATGSSVSCNSVSPRSNQCWTRPDATKTYTFTPRNSDLGKTFTFSAQARTSTYSNYMSYKTVSVTVSDGRGCPSNATQNPDGTCTCTQQYHTWTGGSCVLFCPTTMEPDGAGSCRPAVPPLPRLEDIVFEAARVRSGQPSALSWTIKGMATGITCTISPTPASGQIVWNNQAVWSGTAETPAITQPTQYTLRCENGRDTPVSKAVTAQLIPEFQEI